TDQPRGGLSRHGHRPGDGPEGGSADGRPLRGEFDAGPGEPVLDRTPGSLSAMASKTPGPILAVEDNPDDLFLLERAFEKADVQGHVQIARDGEEATDYLSGKGRYADRDRFPLPAIILLDLNMPKTSGLED